MAVLILSKVKGQTKEGYDSVLAAVSEHVKNADGFIFHGAHPGEGEWQVVEVWETKAQADKWFGKYVVPNLPPGIHPKRNYFELYTAMTAPPASLIEEFASSPVPRRG